MRNTLMNGFSSALYRGLVLVAASADAARRLRGRRPNVRVTWR